MAITIQEDFDQLDGGYAILTLSQSIGAGDASLRIRRLAGEPDKLGAKGWQPHDAVITPTTTKEVGGRTELHFGPALTQHLMEETELEISVVTLNTKERVIWPYITPSVHDDGGGNTIGGGDRIIDVTPPPVPPVTPPKPTGKNDEDDPNRTGDDPIIHPHGPEEETDKTSFRLWWLIPAAVVIAGLAYVAIPVDQDPTPGQDTTEVVPNPIEPEVVAEPEDPTPPPAADTRDTLMAEALACRQNNCDGAAYFDIATRLGEVGVTDVFAIMGLAADGRSVPAMEWLARSYDPLHFVATDGLTNPDLDNAFLYYAQAAEAGSETAPTAQAALCAALSAPDTAAWAVAPDTEDMRGPLERNCE